MTRFFFVMLWLCATGFALNAQKISGIDFDLINAHTSDSTSALYYPRLIERFKALDTTLNDEEYRHIYYGNVNYEHYNPYGKSDGEVDFTSLYSEQKFDKAIPFGKSCLEQNPVNIRVIYRMAICYLKTGENDLAKKYARQYYALINVIYSSGNGNSVETAFVVIKVADEYDVIGDMGLQSHGQALIGVTDRLTVSPYEAESEKEEKAKKKKKNKKDKKENTAELYFNVQKPFEYLSKQFKKEDDE